MVSGSIDEIELRRVSMPLVRPFRTSFGTWTERDVLLVRVRSDGFEGWGECVAGTRPTYSSEYTDGAHRVTADVLGPQLVGAPLDAAGAVEALTPFKGHRMAKAALEGAVLDATLRRDGRSLASHLEGGLRHAMPLERGERLD
ncbi:MAG: o-succinylbenzoate synthase, partial [Actinomycetota bacterium]